MTEDLKNNRKIAHRDDWKITPLPEQQATFILDRAFCDEEMDVLCCGNIPKTMEDKWFWFMEGSTLWAHRSWTGYCIYRIDFKEDQHHVVTVNRNPEQYRCVSIEDDIENLNNLLDWWTKPTYNPYQEWLSETCNMLAKAAHIEWKVTVRGNS